MWIRIDSRIFQALGKSVHLENIEFKMFDDYLTKRSYTVRSPYLKFISEILFSKPEGGF